jgi:hypothetical protein
MPVAFLAIALSYQQSAIAANRFFQVETTVVCSEYDGQALGLSRSVRIRFSHLGDHLTRQLLVSA